MTMNIIDSKTDKILVDALRKLPYRQTKEQFIADAVAHYISYLKNEKVL